MFLDGFQRKKSQDSKTSRGSSFSQQIHQHDPIQAGRLLRAKVATKLGQLRPTAIAVNLKDDLAKSLSKLLVVETKSSSNKRSSMASVIFTQGRARAASIRSRSNDSLRPKSCLSRSISSASAVSAATGLRRRDHLSPGRVDGSSGGGKIAPVGANNLIGSAKRNFNSRPRKLCESHLANRKQQEPTQTRWVTALKASLARSLSLRCEPSAAMTKQRQQQSAPTRRQQFRQFRKSSRTVSSNPIVCGGENLANQLNLNRWTSSGVRRLANSRRSLRSVSIAGARSKRDSLASVIFAMAAWLPLVLFLAVLLPAGQQPQPESSVFASAAPLGPEIKPIWLDDALITLDPSQADTPAPTLQLDHDDDRGNFRSQQQVNREQPEEAYGDFGNEKDDSDNSSDQQQQQRLFSLGGRRSVQAWPEQQPALVAGTSGPDDDAAPELLWIQRRRLERDRALEPPARLRKQPMRRGGYNPPADTERETPEATSGQAWFQARPIRGRQSRQSAMMATGVGGDQVLEEMLGQILDETQGSKSMLEELYSELELRSGANNNGGQQAAAQAQKASLMMAAGDLLSQQANLGGGGEGAIGKQQQAAQEQLLAESMRVAPIVVSQDTSAESAPDGAGSDLVIVGDGVVASGEDNDQLGSASAVNLGASDPNWRSPPTNLANFAQQEPVDAIAGGEGETNLGEPFASIAGSSSDILSQQRLQQMEQAEAKLLQLARAKQSGAQMDSNSAGGENLAKIGFSEGRPISSAPIVVSPSDFASSGQQTKGMPLGGALGFQQQQQVPALNSFHVVEDIDRFVDDSQEANLAPLVLVDASASGVGSGDEEQLEEPPPQQQQPRGRLLADDLLLGAPPSEMNGAQKRAAMLSELLEAQDKLLLPTAASRGTPFWTFAPTTTKRGALPLAVGGAGARPMSLASQHLEEARDFKSAMQMIEAGLLSKEQLIEAATSLRSQLEKMVNIPRGSILGLYPISGQQLLVRLDTSGLDASQMLKLIRNYDFARGFIVISWPKESRQNPLPMLTAILRVLALKWTAADSPGGFQANSRRRAISGALADTNVVPNGNEDDDDEADDAGRDHGDALGAAAAAAAIAATRAAGNKPRSRDELDDRLALLEAAELGAANQQWEAPLSLAPNRARAGQTSHPGWSGSPGESAGQQQLGFLARQLATEQQRLQQQRNMNSNLNLAPTGSTRNGRLSLALLSAYLNSIYRNDPLKSAGWPVETESLDATQLAELLAGSGSLIRLDQAPLAGRRASANSRGAADEADNHSRGLFSSLEAFRLFVLLVVACGAGLMVKLLVGGGGGGCNSAKASRLSRFGAGTGGSLRSLLSSSRSQTSSGEATATKRPPDLESAGGGTFNSGKRRFSCESAASFSETTTSAYESNLTFSAKASNQAKSLSSRLYSLLGGQLDQQQPADCSATPDKQREQQLELKHEPTSATSNAELVVQPAHDVKEAAEDNVSEASSFRSSRSYIKSLIEVLAKAGSQIPSTGRSLVSQYSCSADEFEQSAAFLASESKAAAPKQQPAENASSSSSDSSDENQPGIIMSQMDISAAHLILAYMEKHLEDKERLRREWLELNNSSGGLGVQDDSARANKGANNASQQPTASSSKISQLMLQRLAKVANSEENRHKNRSSMVVPFDRNRVKLVGPQMLALEDKPCAGANGNGETSGAPVGGSVRERGRVLESKQDRQTRSDYINASYIYDDEPRRPTHIIAQGPSEQTIGQFWQMVWEQGISVIVMLTRLNENSIRMCHCYWPANTAGSAGVSNADATTPAPTAQGTTAAAGISGASASANGSSHSKATAATTESGNANAQSAPLTTSSSECTSGWSPTTANGRRGSVTSVFNAPTVAANHPIVANGDLANNVLYFDAHLAAGSSSSSVASLDEEPCSSSSRSKPKTPTTNTGSAKQARVPVKFEVHLVSEHVSSKDFLVRNMYMINRSTGETRTITQFHYLAWPEAGVPENVRSLLRFRRKVHQSYRNLKSPILVHCSDGAGRSGTYTLIDIILERIKKGAKEIDPRATLEHLRDQRIGLCATQSQFQFVLMALAEEIQIILNALPQ